MEPGYEDGYRGITYDLVESSLPHDFYEGVECSETLVTVSEAVVTKKRGKGGGLLSIKPGATVTKEKKEKKDKPVKGNNLRGKGESNPIPFGDRSLKAAQKTGDRYELMISWQHVCSYTSTTNHSPSCCSIHQLSHSTVCDPS